MFPLLVLKEMTPISQAMAQKLQQQKTTKIKSFRTTSSLLANHKSKLKTSEAYVKTDTKKQLDYIQKRDVVYSTYVILHATYYISC